MTDWSVPKGRRVCAGCERAFEPDDVLWSALCVDGPQLVREDRCPDCQTTKPPADPICFWKTTAPHPDRPKKTRLNTEAAGDLLKRLVTEGDPAHRALCYVLALGLVRRRVLKITGSEPAPAPTEEELEAARVYAEAVAARDAARAALEAAQPERPDLADIPVPPPEQTPDAPATPEASDTEPPGAGEPEASAEAEADPDDGLPPRPPPRAIGVLIVHDRETDTDVRVLELALADEEIAAVTAELRELFQGDV